MKKTGADLWQRVTSYDALHAAWMMVSSNRGSAGGDGVSISEFSKDLYANLNQLRAELLGGTYRSGPFKKVSIPKKKPGYRILTIPSIRDRVVHKSIANVLGPVFEALFEDGSFGYRPNRGVVHAVERIDAWRKRGYDVVIEADIVSYFDNVDQEILLDKISTIVKILPGAAALLALLDDMMVDQGKALGTPGLGLVQGSPLSPLLANLYLDALDEEIESQGVKIVRYADDFVILCKSERKAEKVLTHCVKVLAQHGLRLHEDGTRIVSFERGFDFIGYLFLKSIALQEKRDPSKIKRGKPVKSSVTDEGIIELEKDGSRFDPGRRVLYVIDPNHRLDIRNRSFSVLREDGSELIAIPHKRIGRIEVGPGVEFDNKSVILALETNVDLAITDGFGQTKGTVSSGIGKRATVHFNQAKAILNADFRVDIARRLVDARIRNQRTQLSRFNRHRELEEVKSALEVMKRNLRKLDGQKTVQQVRGIEGATTAIYWPALGMVLAEEGSKAFRRTRPARDPLNAVINYMTAILERDIRAAIQGASLHPGFAFLHANRDRHDGLIYDLMEPFRAPLSEGLPVYLFNARRLKEDMFHIRQEEKIEINKEGRHAIITGYETAVAKRVNRPDGAGKLTWRAMMLFQAQSLVRAIHSGEISEFKPYLMEA